MVKGLVNWMGWIMVVMCTGCMDEPKPLSLVPRVLLRGATDISRTSALLSGEIHMPGTSEVNIACFRYGETKEMEHLVQVDIEDGAVNTVLEALSPNSLYYFCLEAGNGHQTVTSLPDSFRTLPNMIPSLNPMIELGHSPMSVLLSCSVRDNGGCQIRSTGFAFRPVGGKKEDEVLAELDENGNFVARLSGLEQKTNYRIRAFAENEVGRFYTEEYPFAADDALVCKKEGMLSQLIGEDERYTYLRVVAPLNGSDLLLLREMAGTDKSGNPTQGKLEVLELGDAKIVEGGVPYDGEHYACADTISVGMFSDLPFLCELQLPHSVKVIEANAFAECPNLSRLSLPDEVVKLEPSTGCVALKEILLSSINPYFHSEDGLLYDKSGTSLIWYPRGKQSEKLELPPTLKAIESYALEGCLARTLVLPASVEHIGMYAFFNSRIESITLPDRLSRVERGMFQNCYSLREVKLGSDMEYLSEYCFDGCPLTDLYLPCDWMPYATELSFAGVPDVYNTCMVHVPQSLNIQYCNHALWSRFKRIVSL